MVDKLSKVIHDQADEIRRLEYFKPSHQPGDEKIENAFIIDILKPVLEHAPDAWFPRGKWATIQAIDERAHSFTPMPGTIPPPYLQVKEHLESMQMTPEIFADKMHMNVNDLLGGLQQIDAVIAGRLADVLGKTSGFWLNLQHQYDENRTCTTEAPCQVT